MDIDAQLAEAFGFQRQLPASAVPAKVTAVEGLLADVETVEGIEIYDVRLCASEQSTSFVKPKKDSWVIIAPLQGKDNFYIAAYTDVEETMLDVATTATISCEDTAMTVSKDGISLSAQNENTTVRVDNDGILLSAQNENLQAVLSDFIDEITKIIVVQGTGPNIPALALIKTRIQTLLKDA